MCNHYQDATNVPLPPQQVIDSHEVRPNNHVYHDPSCHENPTINLALKNLKHRRKNKYLATSQEVAHFEFGAYEYLHYSSSRIHVTIH